MEAQVAKFTKIYLLSFKTIVHQFQNVTINCKLKRSVILLVNHYGAWSPPTDRPPYVVYVA